MCNTCLSNHHIRYGAATAGATFAGTAVGFSDFWAEFDNPMETSFNITAITMDGSSATDFASWKLFVSNAVPALSTIRDFEFRPSESSGLLVGTAECAPPVGPCGEGGKFGVG